MLSWMQLVRVITDSTHRSTSWMLHGQGIGFAQNCPAQICNCCHAPSQAFLSIANNPRVLCPFPPGRQTALWYGFLSQNASIQCSNSCNNNNSPIQPAKCMRCQNLDTQVLLMKAAHGRLICKAPIQACAHSSSGAAIAAVERLMPRAQE